MGVISFSDKQLPGRQAIGASDQPLNSAAPSVPSLRMQSSLSTVANCGTERVLSNSVIHRSESILRGVALIVAASLTISLQDVAFKLFNSQLTLWQIFTLCGILALPALLVLLSARNMRRGVIRTALDCGPYCRACSLQPPFLRFMQLSPF